MNFSVITLFKNITPTFFTFRNFYEKLWGVSEFIYIVGYESQDNYNFIVTKYISQICEIYTIKNINTYNYAFFNTVQIYELDDNGTRSIFILYKTRLTNNNMNEFNIIKNFCFNFIKNEYLSENRKYISVDDDEFLFSSHIESIKEKDEHRFHFVEIICDNNDNKQLEWSLQSWFTHRLNDPVIKYSCGACKTFFFSPFKTKMNISNGFWCHSNDYKYEHSCCQFFMDSNSKSLIFNQMKSLGICYHFTAFNLDILKKVKHKNRFYNDNNKTGNYKSIDENYSNVKLHYQTIIDNELNKYIDDRDIHICKNL